jgi:flagellar biosynthesis/type III secretory pathway protein FliH
VVLTAAQRARAIVAEAEQQAQALRERALAEGREAARAELARELVQLTGAHEQALAALEPQAIAVALRAAKSIVGAEIGAHPEQVQAIVRPLIARLARARAIELLVHPDDRTALDALVATLAARGERMPALRVTPDANVTRGGCVARSEIGTLDAQVETQLAAFARALGVDDRG